MAKRGRPLSQAGAAVRKLLANGTPLTAVEVNLLTGFADLGKQASRMRGLPIKSRKVLRSDVLARLGVTNTALIGELIAENRFVLEYYLPLPYTKVAIGISDEIRIISRLCSEAGIAMPSFEQIAAIRRVEVEAEQAERRARELRAKHSDAEACAKEPVGLSPADQAIAAKSVGFYATVAAEATAHAEAGPARVTAAIQAMAGQALDEVA